MNLYNALRLSPGMIISVVGAGGKTSLLQRLAAELAAGGACVVSATTTAIWQPSGPLAVPLVVEQDSRALLAAVAAMAQAGRVVTAAAGRRMEMDAQSGSLRPKLLGVPPDLPARLLDLPSVDYVLVEADGARGRAIKAPADHEPVLPAASGIVIAVAAIEALGQPLAEAVAHRPELIAALLGLALGDPLTSQHIAALLTHPQAGRKNVPPQARFCPLINKVEGAAALQAARAIAAAARSAPGVDSIVIASLLAVEPVVEVW